ncbi:dolichol-phosphate mannosyltransferase [Ulvibacter sp. MAR_2010_11]|uniref:glycosyltransferase family 2 protein n=1 Tax=Ulvibacter sp. MAR_2010_11 TaxID=1250229 RepID=UPI000C2BD250|nr:glycosyltransferase [Ulvibacter sp. MAR_2010_11]PKA82113.1 dolichol-phosphate mannosyltransferase [Ulvibacter sp. MAR_2010_11]
MNSPEKISVVVPVYYGEKTLDEMSQRLISTCNKLQLSYEIIYVNDASPDASWEVIRKLNSNNPNIRGVNFSKNFGQHYAISAGLAEATGDWVVVMDCDLQDVPEEIEKLYTKGKEGFDVVLARRKRRKDGFLKKFFSRLFYGFLSYLSGARYDASVANFGLYRKSVIQTINSLPEKNRYFPSMVKWVGYKQTAIDVEHSKREEGSSSYTFKKLFNLSLDIILSYSDKPLRLTIKLGLFITFFALVFSGVMLYKWYHGEIEVLGYTSLILSIWFLSGIIILILGVVGLYIGKIFENVKDRPTYIIKEKI